MIEQERNSQLVKSKTVRVTVQQVYVMNIASSGEQERRM